MLTYITITIVIAFILVYSGFKLNNRSEKKKVKRQEEEIMKAADMTRVASYPYIIETTNYQSGSWDKSECTINGIPFTEFDKVIISYKDKSGEVALIHSGNTEWKIMDFYGIAIPIDEKIKTIRRKVGS